MVENSSKKAGGNLKNKSRPSSGATSSSSGKRSASGVKREQGVKSERGFDDEVVPKEKRKAGQNYATPSPGQADRVFYETLLKQKPGSHMAQDWCLAYGVCSATEADALHKRVRQRKGLQPNAPAPASIGSSPTKKARKPSSSGSSRPRSTFPKEMDVDTGFAANSVFEGVGTTGF